LGNCVFNLTARNFNPDVGRAGKITIVEAEELVEPGMIHPDEIHLPGIFVNRIIKANKERKKPIEKLVTQESMESGKGGNKEIIARRVANLLEDGMYVNLGIGLPTLSITYLNPSKHVMFQSENGLLGMGKYPLIPESADPDLINAGKETVTCQVGASTFSSSESFGIVRGSHLDMTILGGMEVSQEGDLANWIIPGKMVKGMGGAMDLVSANSKVVVCMEHTAKGNKKIFKKCSLPLTGKQVVDVLVTELGVFEFGTDGMVMTEISDLTTIEEVKRLTDAEFKVSPSLSSMQKNSSTINK